MEKSLVNKVVVHPRYGEGIITRTYLNKVKKKNNVEVPDPIFWVKYPGERREKLYNYPRDFDIVIKLKEG